MITIKVHSLHLISNWLTLSKVMSSERGSTLIKVKTVKTVRINFEIQILPCYVLGLKGSCLEQQLGLSAFCRAGETEQM
jgi:hypothetical protein